MLVVISENVSGFRNMLIDDNCCAYQIIQKEFNFRAVDAHKIIHSITEYEKPVFRWVPHNLREHRTPKVERVALSK